VSSDGSVHPFGSPFTTTATVPHLPAPIAAAATTPDGAGYWLVGKDGRVYPFGDARAFASGTPLHLNDVVGIAPVSDNEGYWLVTATGGVFSFGRAAYCGGANTRHRTGPIVGIAGTPDGAGYWLVTTRGDVYSFGDAGFFGSGVHVRTRVPVVAMATTPDGKGYWLAYANGSVRNYGDARFFGSAVHRHLTAPIVSIAATPDGGGYWLVGSTGRMANYGDAPFFGSLAHTPPKPPVTVVAVLGTHELTQVSTSPYAPGALGYDVSDFQCKKTGSPLAKTSLPPQAGIAVIEVVGWLDSAQNPCLAAEASWATQAVAGTDPGGIPYSLYLFMNSPDTDALAQQMEASGPAGVCAQLPTGAQAACQAYNYGYNGASDAIAYASSQGVHAPIWWLDVENDALAPGVSSNFAANEYWSAFPALNDQTIQGAIDAVRASGATAGIYSSSIQYPRIAGSFVPKGPQVPLWIAGAPWTSPPYTEAGLPAASVLAAWCAGTAHYSGHPGTDLFAGGVPWLLQETPGPIPSPFGLDPDYAC
jgi:hypothetical protein